MRKSFKFCIYVALGIGVLAILNFIHSEFYRYSAVRVNNDLSQDVVVERIVINHDKSIYTGKGLLKAKSKSFQSGANFRFTYFGKIREISIEGHGDVPFNLTCKIKNDDEYCSYPLTISSISNAYCGCDNSNDFFIHSKNKK